MDREIVLKRTLSRLQIRLNKESSGTKKEKEIFTGKLSDNFSKLVTPLSKLYGDHLDFYIFLEDLVIRVYKSWLKRDKNLKELDESREIKQDWFKSEKMIGAVCYVDLFAEDLKGLENRIDYLKSLGITYLHLMPLFKSPKEENDGGYAVSSYRKVDKNIGTTNELKSLILKLRKNGISLALDFVNNHTSDEHIWAKKAKKGDPFYKEFYHFFPDREEPDQYQKHLRDIFPEIRKGCFTQLKETGEWVWTTFHSYQWDLNYKNPEVFISMAEEMLYLGNLGVEILRLDAVPFTWKKKGTNCENLPEAHYLIEAFNAVTKIAAPALIFKSEAIVHPDEVKAYIDQDKCQISYNPGLMALLWEALATRKVDLLKKFIDKRFVLDQKTAWVNYVRSHDDIGWTFSDEDAAELGINAHDHRNFLNKFYSGDFEGSFSKGMKFQHNPVNNDMRICGTTASLSGLELGIENSDKGQVNDAVNRIELLYGIAMSIGGIPLLYLGDELGALNDYSFQDCKSKKEDTRWVHRVKYDEKAYALSKKEGTIQGLLSNKIKHLMQLRTKHPSFGSENIEVVETGNQHVLAFLKKTQSESVVVLANFSEDEYEISTNNLPSLKSAKELLSNRKMIESDKMSIPGYGLFWIKLAD